MYQYEACLSSLLSVAAAVFLLLPLLGGQRQAGSGFSPVTFVATVLLAAVVVALLYINYRRNIRYSRKTQEIYTSAEDVGNRVSYYQDLLASAENQKELRCYGQQEAILEDVHRVWVWYLKESRLLTRVWTGKTVMDQTTSELFGRVVQRGSHEELAGQEGLYRELWEAQAQYYEGA